MSMPDFNLLLALDVLLQEGSVAGAARRLRLSPSATSRVLARLREATGDPLLVRAGRKLVSTPRAEAVRDPVRRLVQEAQAILRPLRDLDLATLSRTFTLRSSEGFAESFGPALLLRLRAEGPGVRLRFLQKVEKESAPLREGAVDLETGVVGKRTGPELRALALFRDRFVGVVRAGHPLARGRVTAARYARGQHVAASRRAQAQGPLDEALERAGLAREVVATVGGFGTALALAKNSELIASVPERHTSGLREGMHSFPLPFPVPSLTISLLWHPRLDADPAHRWLRERVREVCGTTKRSD